MDRRILTEVKRAISGKVFVFGVLFIFLMLCVLSAEDVYGHIGAFISKRTLLANNYHDSYFLSKIISSEMMIVMPIVCALPAAASFIDDYNGKFIRFYLQRSGRTAYIGGKAAASVLSGGLVILLGAALYYVTLLLLLTPIEAALKDGETAPYYIQTIFKTMSLMFMNSALWAMAGLTLATLTMNKYVAYSGSFIVFYVLVILYERYFPSLYVIYPKEWISPDYFNQLGGFALPLLILQLIIILYFVFACICERRFNDGI